jgi:hypothetical protein
VNIGIFGSLPDKFFRDIDIVVYVSVSDVVPDWTIEHNWFLGNNADMRPEMLQVDRSNVVTVYHLKDQTRDIKTGPHRSYEHPQYKLLLKTPYHMTPDNIIKPLEKGHSRWFSTTRRTYESQSLSRVHSKRKPLENWNVGSTGITKMNVLKINLSLETGS